MTKNYIAGEWVGASEASPNLNPSNTNDVIGEVTRAGQIFHFFAGECLRLAGENVPFGGRKGSSYGPREQGRYAQEFYTTVKTAYTFDGNGPYVPKTKGSE